MVRLQYEYPGGSIPSAIDLVTDVVRLRRLWQSEVLPGHQPFLTTEQLRPFAMPGGIGIEISDFPAKPINLDWCEIFGRNLHLWPWLRRRAKREKSRDAEDKYQHCR
jgi:hypothetical protein